MGQPHTSTRRRTGLPALLAAATPVRAGRAGRRGVSRRRRSPVLIGVLLVGLALTLPAGDSGAQTPPDPVTGVTVTAGEEAGALVIAWDAYPGSPDDYRVKWAPAGEDYRNYQNLDWNAYPTGTQHTVTGLEPGATYKVQVRARFNGSPNSPWSAEVSGQSGADSEQSRDLRQEDTAAPTFSSAVMSNVVGGAQMGLVYNENLDVDSVPAASAFSVKIGSNDAVTPTSVTIHGTQVSLNLVGTRVAQGDTVTVSYTVPPTNPVQDAAGNDAAALTDQSVNTALVDSTPPVLLSATVDGARLVLTYDGNLFLSAPPGNAYQVTVGSAAPVDAGTASIGSAMSEKVGLTLTTAVLGGDVVTLSYTPPDSDPVQDASGNMAAAFTNQAVTNTTASGQPDITGLPIADQVLTAEKGSITDADGTTMADGSPSIYTYSYQWVRVDGVTESDITGATSSTYTLAAADVGKTIKVKVSFLDDASNPSGDLTSDAFPQYGAIESSDTLVTNTNRPVVQIGGAGSLDSGAFTQGFRTGSHSGGYTVTAVGIHVLEVNFTGVETLAVSIYKFDGDQTNNLGDKVADLTTPTLTANSINVFTAPGGTTLAAGTTYLLDFVGTGNLASDLTIAGADNLSGAPSYTGEVSLHGWTIEDHWRNSGTLVMPNGRPVLMNVKGEPAANSPPTFNPGLATTISVAENSAANTDVGTPFTATDANSDTLTYSLSDTVADSGDAANFTITSSGQIRTTSSGTYDHEDEPSYAVTVNVRDSKDASGSTDTAIDASLAITITITDVQEPGSVSVTGTERGGSTLTATATDPDNVSSPSWQWMRASSSTGTFSDISSATASTYRLVAADVGQYLKAEVTYTDDHASGQTATSASTGQIAANNIDPSFPSMTATRSLPENTTTVMDIGDSFAVEDPDNDTLGYTFSSSGLDSQSFTFHTSTGRIRSRSDVAYDYETKSSYTVQISITDSKDAAGDSDSAAIDDTVTVTINLTNVDEPGTVTISGTLSGGEDLTASVTDLDGEVSSLTWQWARSATATGTFTNISGATSATYTLVADDVGKYLQATASYTDPQGSGKSADATTGQIGASNAEPSFSASTATRTVPENSGAGANVGTVVTATDSDSGDTLHYSLSGTDAGSFTINSASGQILTKAGVTYNFEATKNSYDVTVNARDSKDAAGNADTATDDTIDVTINLTNVNEAPTITTTATSRNVPENSTAVITFASSDVDASDTRTWSIDGMADDNEKFAIDQNTGALSFKTAPDYETPNQAGATDNRYRVTVKVTDAGNDGAALSDSQSLTVNVTNVNEPPTIDSGPSSVSVDENTVAGTLIATFEASDVDASSELTWSLEGEDADDLGIRKNPMTGVGELRFAGVPDFEMPTDDDDADANDPDNVYDVTVVVKDNHLPQARAELDVSVTVNDLNETPVVSGAPGHPFPEIEFDVDEADLTADDYVLGMYTATDDDNKDGEDLDTITWGVSGTDADHFTIDTNTGELSFKTRSMDNRLDFENPDDDGSNNVYEVVIEADDGQGESNSVGTFAVTVTVTPVNETPEITTTGPSHEAPMFMEIEYDATSADLNVADYDGRDEEGETITWSLGGADQGDFSINSTTGVLTFNSRPNFEMPADADGDNDYEITVRATDASSKMRLLPVVVTVTDVDETPEFTNPPAAATFAEIEYDFTGTPDLVVATFTARDEEGEDLTWTLEGPDGTDDFAIAEVFGEGVVSFKASPNFELSTGSGTTDNIYEFIVLVQDAGPDRRERRLPYIVTVTDVNEQPRFVAPLTTSVSYDENDTSDVASYTAYDEEGIVEWSLTGTDAGDFEIDAGGTVRFVNTPNWEDPEDANNDNVYSFNVVATDVASGTSRRNVMRAVTVTVNDLEEPGTISVSNFDPSVGQLVRFELSDPDGGIKLASSDIDWVIQAREPRGPGDPVDPWTTLSLVDASATTYNYIADEDQTGQEIRATVKYIDRRGSDKAAESEVTNPILADPSPNVRPRFRLDDISSIEEGPIGTVVGTLTATDRDNDTLTFGIQEGEDSDFFAVNPSTGQITLAQEVDFEALPPAIGDRPLLLFTATVSDGKAVDETDTVINDDSVDATNTLSVSVADIEEAGVVTLSDAEPGVDVTVHATLADSDGEITGQSWQWARSINGRTNWFNISGETSSSYTTVQSDANFFLRARVTYTDRRGGGKSAEAVTAQRIFGENQRPTFPSTEDGARTIPENTRSGVNIGAPVAASDPEGDSLTYALSGTDAAAFTINASTGQLRTSGALDFEDKSSYSLTVEVHDRKDGLGEASNTVDDTQAVTITLENVEEPGTVTLTTLSQNIQARVEVTAVLEDDDGFVPADIGWRWSRSPNGRSGWVNIAGATSVAYTPTLEDSGNYIRATANYTDGHGPNKTAQGVSPRVGDPPPINSAPAFPATENGQRDVPEDVAGGSPIAEPVVANDVNADALTYSLSGTDAASFTIDASTGQIRLAQNVQLDFEGKRSYRVTVSVTDGNDEFDDPDGDAIDDTINVTITVTDINEAPVITGDASPSYQEDANAAVATYTAADPERDTLTWTVSNNDFWISSRGQLHFASPPSYEDRTNYSVTVEVMDDEGLSDSLSVTVTVTDAEEAGIVTVTPLRGWDGTRFSAGVTDDDGQISGESWQWARSTNRSSWSNIAGATSSSYTATADDVGHYLQATVSYSDRRGSNKQASAVVTGRIGEAKPAANNEPEFAEPSETRSVGQGATAGRRVGAPLRATDPDTDDVLTYSLSGSDADSFDIDPATGQLQTKDALDPDVQDTYTVTISVHDGFNPNYDPSTAEDASVDVIITVTAVSQAVFGGFTGGFAVGGGGGGPEPSEADFEWNVERDIEALDSDNDTPAGAWSDGATLWILDNAPGAGDAIYAYDLETGERVEDREFALHETNRAPRGVWSDGTTVWVSDSGQDRIFAYDLATGERVEEREIVLTRRNRDARGIWSDGANMWVLNANPSLFAYDLESGELLTRFSLDPANSDPRGLWSDGVTVWVSDDNAKRLFAYRLPVPTQQPRDEDEEPPALERVSDEEFAEPGRVGNNSPRGIWSDGAVMYVADENDDKVYTYNVPDAIDARLASLSLAGVEIGEFSPAQREYEGVPDNGVTSTTVEAQALQPGATVAIEPGDADEATEGHQVELAGVEEIAVTVTSSDGSRERTYRVTLAETGPSASCLRGAVAVGFSLVLFEGGSLDDLVSCAQGRHATALYALHEGEYVSYFPRAPEFVTARFRGLFADGVPALLPLVVRSEGPATPAPAAPPVTEPFAQCLSGEIGEGFSLVVYEGGSVAELDSCAAGFGVTAVYALVEGEYVPYFLGAPEFVTARFRALFPDGVPSATPLTVRGEGP